MRESLFFSFEIPFMGTGREVVLMAAFMSPIVVLLGVYKWKLLVNGSGFKATWKSSIASYLGGMGIGLFTPMRVGELSRIFFLSGNREVLLGAALLDKAIDLQILLLLSTIGCFLFFGMKMAVVFGGSSILLLSCNNAFPLLCINP